MKTVTDIITEVIAKEGSRYTNHPSDRGGPTKYGITQATLSRFRRQPVSAEQVAALTEKEARQVYYQMFVSDPGFEQVLRLDESIAAELVDSGVMSGPARPTAWLQRALNALNQSGTLYPDIAEDARIGPQTLSALAAYLKARGKSGRVVLLRALNCLQGAFLLEISRTRPANEDFTFGWILQRVEL